MSIFLAFSELDHIIKAFIGRFMCFSEEVVFSMKNLLLMLSVRQRYSSPLESKSMNEVCYRGSQVVWYAIFSVSRMAGCIWEVLE